MHLCDVPRCRGPHRRIHCPSRSTASPFQDGEQDPTLGSRLPSYNNSNRYFPCNNSILGRLFLVNLKISISCCMFARRYIFNIFLPCHVAVACLILRVSLSSAHFLVLKKTPLGRVRASNPFSSCTAGGVGEGLFSAPCRGFHGF